MFTTTTLPGGTTDGFITGNISVDDTNPSSQGIPVVVFGTNGVVVFSSGGRVVYSTGGPVVPGTALVTGRAVDPGFPAVVVYAGGTQMTICTSEGSSGPCGVITTFDPGIGGRIINGDE
jgi:hypothetical protein